MYGLDPLKRFIIQFYNFTSSKKGENIFLLENKNDKYLFSLKTF